jgi:hypothetical protein
MSKLKNIEDYMASYYHDCSIIAQKALIEYKEVRQRFSSPELELHQEKMLQSILDAKLKTASDAIKNGTLILQIQERMLKNNLSIEEEQEGAKVNQKGLSSEQKALITKMMNSSKNEDDEKHTL